MDELKWYENLTYNEAKDILQEKMENMKQNFIAAGYYLKYIRDNKLYLEDGYQTIWEFAEDNYGIKMSTASRWMSMNDKFSDGGNSPCLADQYKEFGKSQLQEMLYLTDDQMEQAVPEMSAKEIRAIRKPEEPVAPAQEEPQKETEINSCVELRKPDKCERKYLECLAEHLILSLHDWFLADYTNRVLMVNNSPRELKEKLGEDNRSRYFSTETGAAHANLLDEYVQLWDEKSNFMGNYEWFYLASAIQSTWNSVALMRAEADREKKENCIAKDSVAPAQIEEMEEPEIIDPEEAVVVTGLEDAEVEEDLYEEASDHSGMDLLKIELEKAQRLLKDLKKCYTDNDIRVRKQKLIVAALAGMLCDLEDKEDLQEPIQPPLPIMKIMISERNGCGITKIGECGMRIRILTAGITNMISQMEVGW